MKPVFDSEKTPRRLVESITFDSEPEARRRLIHSEFCDRCARLSLKTKADAHSYIGLLLSKPGSRQRGTYALQPYKCPVAKGWHIGRNPHTRELLEKGNQ